MNKFENLEIKKENLKAINGGNPAIIGLALGAGYFLWNAGYNIGKDIANNQK